MCEFFSGVITKEGKVFWFENLDSHDQIIQKAGLHESHQIYNSGRQAYAQFEITPPSNDQWERDLSKWNFRIDERIKPTWFGPEYEKTCRDALAECIEKCLIIDADIDELENRNGLIIVNSKIKVVKACNLRVMRESSQVGVMGGSSRVGEMWGSSIAISRKNEVIEVIHPADLKIKLAKFKAPKVAKK
jgi:hypothetical protein